LFDITYRLHAFVIYVNRRSCCPVWRSQKLLVGSVGVRVTLKSLLSCLLTRPQRRDRLGARATVQLRCVVVVVVVSTCKASCVTMRADFCESAVCFRDLYCVVGNQLCI